MNGRTTGEAGRDVVDQGGWEVMRWERGRERCHKEAVLRHA